METVVRNLWAARNVHMRPTFTYTGRAVLQHRGVQVFRNPAGSWDYVFGGAVITQRAGYRKESAVGLIDDLLEGRDLQAAEVVREHISRTLAA